MEKQTRLMFMLAAVLLALVAVIVLAKPSADTDTDQDGTNPAETWSPVFAELTAADIDRIDLKVDSKARTIARDEAGWHITAPVDAPAEADRVEALVDSFATVQVGPPLGGDAAEYGLAPAGAVITLTDKDGTAHVLEIGHDAPVGGHSYVQDGSADAERTPRATRTRLSANLDVPLSDLRMHKLWSLPRTTIDHIHITGPTAALDLEERAGDWWVDAALSAQDAPPDADAPSLSGQTRRASAGAVQALVAMLGSLEATGFVDDADVSTASLPWEIRASTAGVDLSLRLGQNPVGDWIATGPRQPGLVTIDPSWLDAVQQPVTHWWATDLLTIDELSLSKIELKLGDQQLIATRTEAGWDATDATGVLDALGAVRVDRSDAPTPQGAPWGRLSLTSDKDAVRSLSFHQALPDGGRVVRDEAGGAPFVISALELGRLEGALPVQD